VHVNIPGSEHKTENEQILDEFGVWVKAFSTTRSNATLGENNADPRRMRQNMPFARACEHSLTLKD
jgi:hypothetical protein